jgi:hypothetical protein
MGISKDTCVEMQEKIAAWFPHMKVRLIALNDDCCESGEMILSSINGEWLSPSKITTINGTDMMVGYWSAGGEWMQRWLRLHGVDTLQCDILKLRKLRMLGILLTVMAFLIGQEVGVAWLLEVEWS